MDTRYGPSPLRERYNKTILTHEAAKDLSGFKSGAVNFKLGFWDPSVNGVRYLKALIYNLAAGLSSENWARLRKIKNRDTGSPISIHYNGEPVCMDYLLAVLELDFIARDVDLTGQRVLEVGAGYGRSCHAMLSNYDVETYHIVDLDNSLELARGYLASVLDEHEYAKVRFVSPGDLDALPDDETFGLGLSVNAFAEMPVATVRDYLSLLDRRARHVYVRDAVGKYLEPDLDGHAHGRDLVGMALSTGPLQQVIDIHDSAVVERQAERFVEVHRPGPDWSCVNSAWARPWSYYWQALYRHRSDDAPEVP